MRYWWTYCGLGDEIQNFTSTCGVGISTKGDSKACSNTTRNISKMRYSSRKYNVKDNYNIFLP